MRPRSHHRAWTNRGHRQAGEPRQPALPGTNRRACDTRPKRRAELSSDPGSRVGDLHRPPIHDSRNRRRFRHRGDSLSVGESHPGYGFPHHPPESGGRLSETDGSFDSRLSRGTMLRGLWKLTWIEIKVFMREPLGAFGSIGIPVVVFLVAGRVAGPRFATPSLAAGGFVRVSLPVLAALLIAVNSV